VFTVQEKIDTVLTNLRHLSDDLEKYVAFVGSETQIPRKM
jgi:hypothetical protein